MAPHSIEHPPVETLRAFALGKLTDSIAADLLNHLDGCPDCVKQGATLSGEDFLIRLRQTRGGSITPAPGFSDRAPPGAGNLPTELAGNPHYEILRELGRGGMGVVYLAKNKLMDRFEVLKVVNKALLDHPGAVERFLREIRSAARLSHANVVGAYSAVQQGEMLAFAMEYIEGEDLASLVRSQGPLPVPHACFYVQQAALGLQHAFEKQMVHRDIKPQNLILAREGKKHIVKVLDFGLAKVMREKSEDTGLTGEGRMLGTPDYIAPEQTMDAAKADIRADIYSLGCTLYFLLSGRPPFSGTSLGAILVAHQMHEAKPLNLVRPEVPEELAAVVRKMMAKSPAKRYQTPREVVQALSPFVKQGIMPKPAPELSSGAPKPPIKNAVRSNPLPTLAAETRKTAQLSPTLAEGNRASVAPRQSGAARKPPAAPAEKRSSGRKWLLGGGLGVSVLLLASLGMWAGGVFEVKTKDGILVIEVNEPKPDVLVDGETVTVAWNDGGKKAEIRVKPGTHKIEVKKDGFSVDGKELTFKDGDKEIFTARLVPNTGEARAAAPPQKALPTEQGDKTAATRPATPGYTALFNGKDLTGWTKLGNSNYQWGVVDGMLLGHWGGENTHGGASLSTQRSDYQNFRFRIETMPGRNWAYSMVFLWQRKDDRNRWCKANIGTVGGQDEEETGVFQAGSVRIAPKPPIRLQPREWLTQEVVVEGKRVRVFVNNVLVTNYMLSDLPKPGRLGINVGGGVKIRKIEVQELPPPAAPPAAADGFVPLFNGRDLSGWKVFGGGTGDWKVVDGAIVGSGRMSHLFSERGDYENFHYRVEAWINDGGNSGQYFRTELSPGFPKGYEAQINSTHKDTRKTGSLYNIVNINDQLHKPGEWFTQEVIAQGDHIVIAVNGKTVVDTYDSRYKKGHFALQHHDPGTMVKFRKIELKELPAEPPPRRAANALPPEAKKAAEAFEKACAGARDKLIADFDTALDRLAKFNGSTELRLKLIAAVRAEKKRFEDKGLIPWSEPMRPFLAKYLVSMTLAEGTLRRAYDSLVDAQLRAKNPSMVADLQADRDSLLRARVVARWRHFVDGKPFGIRVLYSNGKISHISGKATWRYADGVLTYLIPDPHAVRGIGIDTLQVSMDGSAVSGFYNNGRPGKKLKITEFYTKDD